MTKTSKKRKLAADIAAAVVLILCFAFNILGFFENRIQDVLFQEPARTDPGIVVIGIDDYALETFGPYNTWSRQLMADAVNILNSGEYKPAVIALDILYNEEGNDPEADAKLARAAEDGGNVVIAALAESGLDMSLNNVITDFMVPFPALEKVSDYGFSNSIIDNDGIIRRTELSNSFDGEEINSFPYKVYNKYAEYLEMPEEQTPDEAYITFSGEPGDYSWGFSFADIFADDFDPDFFGDCIMFIGSYTTGLGDAYYTSIDPGNLMYGVEINANITQMLLEGNIKTWVPPFVNWAIVICVIAVGLILSKFTDIRVLLAISVVLAAGFVFASVKLFEAGYIVTIIYPVFSLILLYIYRLIYGYVLETLEKARVKSVFKKYVDPKLVDKLVESGEANSNEVGLMKDIAVLFVDVRGFTPMTERLSDQPETVVRVLNEYLELTTRAVFENGGSVDKFIGDATMALFNGFVPTEDYVYKAVKAGWDIVQGAMKVNESIKQKYGIEIGFGVGINCGNAIVGNLGPSFRKDYTAIGDTVNTAARLESNAGRSEVLISRSVYDIVKDRVEAVSKGEIPLKGKSVKIEVFNVTGLKGNDAHIAKAGQ